MKTLKIYYRSAAHLEVEGFDAVLADFLRKRMAHFLSDFNLEFFQLQNDFPNTVACDKEDPSQILILTSLINPLLDEMLLRKMVDAAIARPDKIMPRGEVPGTAASVVCRARALQENAKTYFVNSNLQRRYNSQFNLGRLRRLKLFKSLMEKFPDLHAMKVEDILEFFGTKGGVELIIAYGEPVKLKYLDACPLCEAKDFDPVHADVSQPLTGFLTRHSRYYLLCNECGLVFANPHMPDEELWRYYDRFSYDASDWTPEKLKHYYENLNHIDTSHYYNYVAAMPYVKQLPEHAKAVDLGGGDGEFTVLLRKNCPEFEITIWDYRILPLVENGLKEWNVLAKQSDFLVERMEEESYDLMTNWEVIEHLPIKKLEMFFKKIYDALKPGGMYIFSTPDFDNPYCQALDFWAITPGEHLSVLSRKVLEPLLKRCGFEIIAEHHECVGMKIPDRWYKYGQQFNASMASRAESHIINDFLKDEAILQQHQNWMREKNLGSEIILCCRK